MVDPHSKKDIEKISLEILKASKSLDVFPTPVNQIVEYSELTVVRGIDVSKIHESYFDKATDALRRAVSKVRGLLDRREKKIYLDLTQKTERKNFVKLHEVGHEVLPWQAKIHDVLDDDDKSLRSDVHETFEDEANFFATITLFQHDRFHHEIKKLPLSMESVMHTAKQFGASIHAASRRYIECSSKRCALLILENFSGKGSNCSCTIRNFFSSDKFGKEYGQLLFPKAFDVQCEFVKDYIFNRRLKTDGIISFDTENGPVFFNYHFFNNTYNSFVFIFPKGEKIVSRSSFIVSADDLSF